MQRKDRAEEYRTDEQGIANVEGGVPCSSFSHYSACLQAVKKDEPKTLRHSLFLVHYSAV